MNDRLINSNLKPNKGDVMKKCFFVVVEVLLFSMFISGCASQKAWVYKPNTYSQSYVFSEKTAVILPFSDQREDINKNRILVYMIPLMPFGWADYNAPEGAQMHLNSGIWINYKPTEDFAKALAQELEEANIFKESYFDFKKGSGDISIKGKIINTKYSGTLISYGLSVYGPLLWLVGLPSGTVNNELSIELSCTDIKTNKLLFSKTYLAPRYSKVSWIYNLPNDFNYSSMLKGLYKQFLLDLKNEPNIFK